MEGSWSKDKEAVFKILEKGGHIYTIRGKEAGSSGFRFCPVELDRLG
jgi:hypothetical protein